MYRITLLVKQSTLSLCSSLIAHFWMQKSTFCSLSTDTRQTPLDKSYRISVHDSVDMNSPSLDAQWSKFDMLGFTSHNKRCIINKSAPEIPTLLCKCSDCLMHAVHRSVLSKTGKKAVLHISYNQLATVMSKILSSSTQRIILPVRAEYLKILQTYEVLRHRLIPGPGNRNWWSIAWSP